MHWFSSSTNQPFEFQSNLWEDGMLSEEEVQAALRLQAILRLGMVVAPKLRWSFSILATLYPCYTTPYWPHTSIWDDMIWHDMAWWYNDILYIQRILSRFSRLWAILSQSYQVFWYCTNTPGLYFLPLKKCLGYVGLAQLESIQEILWQRGFGCVELTVFWLSFSDLIWFYDFFKKYMCISQRKYMYISTMTLFLHVFAVALLLLLNHVKPIPCRFSRWTQVVSLFQTHKCDARGSIGASRRPYSSGRDR